MWSNNPERSAQHLLWVDVLKGIAVFAVIAVHTVWYAHQKTPLPTLFFGYGQMGVQLFFVISAIMSCFTYERRSADKYALGNFFVRRFFRIAPAYYIAMLFYALWRKFDILADVHWVQWPWQHTSFNVWTNIFFVHGWYQVSNYDVVPGGWSIGAEMAFYMVFPAIWYFLRKRSITTMCVITCVQIATSLAVLVAFNKYHSWVLKCIGFPYFSIFNQATPFMIGMITYKIMKAEIAPKTYVYLLPVLLTAINLYIWDMPFEYVFFIMPITASLSFMALAIIAARHVRPCLWSRMFAAVGKVAFSMYLIQFCVLDLCRFILDKLGMPGTLVPIWGVVSLTTYVLATFSYRFIEKPGMALGEKLISKYGGGRVTSVKSGIR